MAVYLGKKGLLEAKTSVLNYNENVIKGIDAEIFVGDFLSKALPENAYVVAHPNIGKYNPDFIVLSPDFGIRIIEVKNWNRNYINQIYSNGLFLIKDKRVNPLEQARRQAECLNQYLSSNYGIDAYKDIGYIVVHCGFSSDLFQSFSHNWNREQTAFFNATNIARNQLDSNIEFTLQNATKFRNNRTSLRKNLLKKIAEEIEFAKFNVYDDELYEITVKNNQEIQQLKKKNEEVDELKKKTAQLESQLNDISINLHKQEETEVFQSEKEKGKSKILFLVLAILLIFSGLFLFSSLDGGKVTIKQLTEGAYLNDAVTINAKVEDFLYIEDSETKLLKLSDGTAVIDAVIFKNTKVPYINIGEEYKIYGIVSEYENKYEIVIDKIEPLGKP